MAQSTTNMAVRRRTALLAGLVGLLVAGIGLMVAFAGWPAGSAPPQLDRNEGRVKEAFVLLGSWVDQPGKLVSIDPRKGGIGISVATGTDPAFAVSPNRKQIYLASGQDAGGRFWVLDVSSGKITHEEALPVRWLNTMPAYFPSIVVSPDGRWVYVLASESAGPGRDAYYARIFDTAAAAFRETEFAIPCVAPLLVATQEMLHAACPHSGLVLSTALDRNGGFGLPATAEVSESGIVGMIQQPGSSDLLVLTRTGVVVRLGPAGAQHLFKVVEGASDLVYGAFSLSPDGSTLYIGRDGVSQGRIKRIEAYDTFSGRQLADIDLPVEAWTFSVGSDGDRLYAAAHGAGRLLLLDARSLEVISQQDVAGNPIMATGP